MQTTLPYSEENEVSDDCLDLPNGWQVKKLGQLVKLKSGGTPSKSNPTYWNGDIPWLSAKDLKSFRLSSAQDMVTELAVANGTHLISANHLLILVRGMTLLKDVPIGLTTCAVAFNQDLKAMEVRQGTDAAYLAYWLVAHKEYLKDLVDRAGHGTGRLPTERLIEVKVCLPSLPEQALIAKILDDADAVVRASESLIEAKSRYKRALAEQLLTGKFRFPEFKGQAWREAKLGEFLSQMSERCPVNETPVVLSCSKLYGILLQSDRFSKQMASHDLRRYKFVEAGNLVFDPMLLWDASIAFSELRGVVSPAYCTLQFVSEQADRRFFRYLLYTATMRYNYKAISKGTNARRKKVTASDFLKIDVRIPSLLEQSKIAEVLELVDSEIALLRRELDVLKKQKQELMHQLLTGQVRVKEFHP